MANHEEFQDVLFEFVCDKKTDVLNGSVVLRGRTMQLRIPEGEDNWPYLLKGAKTPNGYAAENAERNSARAEARWASLGEGQYVGLWVEDGRDCFFKFELVKPRSAR
jgi:hypothetical protein